MKKMNRNEINSRNAYKADHVITTNLDPVGYSFLHSSSLYNRNGNIGNTKITGIALMKNFKRQNNK